MRAVVLIVALLALSAVALFVVQTVPARIESDLKQRSSQALASANLNFAKVTVVGRAVTLSGEAPGPVAKEQAVKVAGDVWGVAAVHDLHVWTLTSGLDAASGHLGLAAGADLGEVLREASDLLADEFGITHATLQCEPPGWEEEPGRI